MHFIYVMSNLKMQSSWRNYLGQLIIVMVGVFLGMLVSDWNAERKLNKNRKAILVSIKKELEANKVILEDNLNKMKPFYSVMDSLYREGRINDELTNELFYARPFDERLPNWKGFGSDNLSNAMFEAAKYSNVIPGMDIELLEKLSAAYSLQELDESMNKTFLDLFLNMDSAIKYRDVLGITDRIRQELNSMRAKLILEYEESIVLMDELNK